MKKFALWTLAFLLGAGAWTVRAGEDRVEILKENGQLDEDSPLDKKTNTFHKVHGVKLAAGQFIHIELKSKEFRPLLRVVGPSDKILVEDAKSGAQGSRVVKIEKRGTYQFVVGGATKEKTGEYSLMVTKASFKDRADYLRSKLASMYKANAATQDGFLSDLKDLLAEKADTIAASDLDLVVKGCRSLEYRTDISAIYEDVIAVLSKGPKSAEPHVNFLKGILRRTPGHEISVLTGTTTGGDEFNWKDYRGKIVLIDFWATWCGPCRAELPNVLKLYSKYHDKGFEVVGISTDSNRAALDTFLEKQKLPWTCLHESGKSTRPMASRYGLSYIPLAILVDREGKVLSMHARGAELARLLEKHVGEK